MTIGKQIRFWLIGAALLLAGLWVLRDMLLPFVAGIAIAYFITPVVNRLEKPLRSRAAAVLLVMALAALAMIGVVLAIAPLVSDQASSLAAKLPNIAARLLNRIQPLIEPLREKIGMRPESIAEIEAAAASYAGDIARLAGRLASGLLSQSFAFLNLLALVFLTPVIAFYLLRDWPILVSKLDGLLPRAQADTIRGLAREADAAVAGYVRGQATVCGTLGVYYGAGLAIVGLDFGLVIGLIVGLISFIPFVGSWAGGLLSIGMALAQFPPNWTGVGLVGLVFLIGQFLEGNILAPKLVGDRVGLHPVWLMFALLAGGTLFGFVGLLLSVPVASVIGVLVRFVVRSYLASPYYGGAAQPPKPLA